jgi:hypothetical protein
MDEEKIEKSLSPGGKDVMFFLELSNNVVWLK